MNERCIKCNRPSTYVSPEFFCDEHWLAWWNEEMGDDPMTLDDAGCPIVFKRFDDHVRDCELCCSMENEFEYCTIGESLEETWAETIEEDDE